jgi:hypothetical protein
LENLDVNAMEDAGIFFVRLVYFTAIWYISWLFWYSCWVIWYISPRLGMLHQEKSGNPALVDRLGTVLRIRVTRLGEFSPFGSLFTLDRF